MKRMLSFYELLLFCLISSISLSPSLLLANNENTQVVRGQVLDISSKAPIEDAIIEILNMSPRIVVRTDAKGKFRMENVPIGRHKILFSKEGYNELVINGLDVTAAKEVVLVIKLEEMVNVVTEENITNSNVEPIKNNKLFIIRSAKDLPNNEFAITTVRLFSKEEIGRFAGMLQDPARIMGGYAGMSNIDDYNNHLSVRGGSPSLFQWRVDGIPVQNPNQFSIFGGTGGKQNILNPNTIDNSDLYLGGSPAEMGNCAGSVFDATLHKGNEEKFEFLLQTSGTTGLQAMLEGPLSKKKNGSFMAAFRYNLFNFVNYNLVQLSAPSQNYETFSTAPRYWDYTVKVDLPKGKAGEFSFFAIGGLASERMDGTDSVYADRNPYIQRNEQRFLETNIGIVGLRHRIALGKRQQGYLTTRLGGTLTQIENNSKLLLQNDEFNWFFNNKNDRFTLVLSSNLTQKISRKFSLRAGFLAETHTISSYELRAANQQNEYVDSFNITTILSQLHAQTLWKPNRKLILSFGVNAQHLLMNNKISVEPKFSLRWFIANRHSLFIAVGVYNQMQPWQVYGFEQRTVNTISGQPQVERPFIDAPFINGRHYFYGYEFVVSQSWRIRADIFNRSIRNFMADSINPAIATANLGGVDAYPITSAMLPSIITLNAGGEITIEKFFDRGYYMVGNISYLFSRYQSKTKLYNSPLYISPFGDGLSAQVLIGKEFRLGDRNRMTIDLRANYKGSQHGFGVDTLASANAGITVYDYASGTSKLKDYFRADVKVGFVFNGKAGKISHWFFLDFINVANYKNTNANYYDNFSGMVNPIYQRPLSVDVFYQVRF